MWRDGPGVLVLPDGRRIRGRGLRHQVPDGPVPAYGVYLLGKGPAVVGWPNRWVRWPDFRLPASRDDALAAAAEVWERSAFELVEVGCGGGIGRTGTFLAAVAVHAGIPPGDAVAWVRRHYHPKAVETPWQRRWVARLPA